MNDKLLRVLCLEDNSIDCQLIKAILAEQNLILQIQHAKTGSDFQDKLKRTKFDVILSDFTLPGYSGMAALQKAKEIQLETPFIFVSGTIGEERAVEGLKSGATDYVLKDNLERLGPAVRRAIAETQEHQSRKHAEDALRESEARFRQVAENIEEVFSLVDLASNKILHVSPAYEKIWKCSCDSLCIKIRTTGSKPFTPRTRNVLLVRLHSIEPRGLIMRPIVSLVQTAQSAGFTTGPILKNECGLGIQDRDTKSRRKQIDKRKLLIISADVAELAGALDSKSSYPF